MRAGLVLALCSLALVHAVQYGEYAQYGQYYPPQQFMGTQPRFQQVYPGQEMYAPEQVAAAPYPGGSYPYQPLPYGYGNNFIQNQAYADPSAPAVDPNAMAAPVAAPVASVVDAAAPAATAAAPAPTDAAAVPAPPAPAPAEPAATVAPPPNAAGQAAAPAPAPVNPASAADKKLQDALMQVQTDLLAKGLEIKKEAKWIQDVEEIMNQYNTKIANVHTNINTLKDEMRVLLQKKRQIQNIQIQRTLENKLEQAQASLGELNSQLDSITKKSDEFGKNRADIQATIDKITGQISTLQSSGAPPAADAAPADAAPATSF